MAYIKDTGEICLHVSAFVNTVFCTRDEKTILLSANGAKGTRDGEGESVHVASVIIINVRIPSEVEEDDGTYGAIKSVDFSAGQHQASLLKSKDN